MDVKIMSCQVFSGSKGCDLYQEAKAVKYAADNGAVILQCPTQAHQTEVRPKNARGQIEEKKA